MRARAPAFFRGCKWKRLRLPLPKGSIGKETTARIFLPSIFFPEAFGILRDRLLLDAKEPIG